MALKHTLDQMKKLLQEIHRDLEKSERGNRAAAQRARTCSIKFAKVAKLYRKESIAEAKKGKKTAKKTGKPQKKTKKRK